MFETLLMSTLAGALGAFGVLTWFMYRHAGAPVAGSAPAAHLRCVRPLFDNGRN